jgi:hypothetical protein
MPHSTSSSLSAKLNGSCGKTEGTMQSRQAAGGQEMQLDRFIASLKRRLASSRQVAHSVQVVSSRSRFKRFITGNALEAVS